MNTITKIIIVLALVIAVGGVVILKEKKREDFQAKSTTAVNEEKQEDLQAGSSESPGALPLLIDLGAEKCIPCKMMAPILEGLKEEYGGIFDVEFIDVRKRPEAGRKYGIRVIPTQIFFDAGGNELFRHEGFFSKEDILAKWKEVGVDIGKSEE